MTLPVELYRPILQHVCNNQDLCTLSRASTTLQFEAERLLYRSLRTRTSVKLLSLCKILTQCPRLSAHVRSFDLQFDVPTAISTLLPVASALRSLPKLVSLHLFAYGEHHRHPLGWLLPRGRLFKLSHFYCGFEPDAELLGFLEDQRSIVHLRLTCINFGAHGLASTALPRLKIFEGSASLAKRIVPGRPVTHLMLYGIKFHGDASDLESFMQLLACLATSTQPIRALQSTAPEWLVLTRRHVELLAEFLPNLRHLGDCSFRNGCGQLDMARLPYLVSCIVRECLPESLEEGNRRAYLCKLRHSQYQWKARFKHVDSDAADLMLSRVAYSYPFAVNGLPWSRTWTYQPRAAPADVSDEGSWTLTNNLRIRHLWLAV